MSLTLIFGKSSFDVWNLEIGQIIHSYKNLRDIYTTALSKDNQFLVMSFINGNAIVMRLREEQEPYNLDQMIEDYARNCCVLDDGSLVLAFNSGSVRVYNLETKTKIRSFELGCECICYLDSKISLDKFDRSTIARNGSYIVSEHFGEKKIKIFNLKTGKEEHSFQIEVSYHTSVLTISNNGKFLAVANLGRSISIFDLDIKKQIAKIIAPKAGYGEGGVMSPDSKYVVNSRFIYSLNLGRPEEFNYVSPKIPDDFVYATGYDDFLISPWSEDADTRRRYLLYYQDMYVAPYNWTALHLLAIFNPHAIAQITQYPVFQVPFLIDHYERTPLHYLLAQKNYDYTIINILLKYILDYLEDKNRVRGFDYQKICSSLSDCFSRLAYKYLHLSYPETFPQYNQVIPAFGNSKQSYIYSQLPVMSADSLLKLHQEGDDRIIFRTNMICLDYDPRSNNMLITTRVFSELEQEGIFKIPIIENLIDHLWDSTRMTMNITALTFSVLMILLSLYIGSGQPSVYLEISIIILTSVFIISEGIQSVSLGAEYFKNVWNYIDITQLLLTIIFMFMKTFNEQGILGEAWIVSTIIITGYLRWLSYLRLFTSTRILIEIILTVLYDMLGFITIIASILVGFSLIFLEFARIQQDTYEYGFHFYNTFKLLFGNYDDTEYTLSQKILVSSLLCVLNVVLLNLLIAIIGDSYGKVQEGRDLIDAKTRLEMIQEAMILMRTLAPKKDLQKGYLIYKLSALSEEGDTQNQEWEARMNKIEEMLQKSKDEQQENLNNGIKSLGEQIYQIKNEVKKDVEQQTNQVMKSLGEQIYQIKNEVKKDVEQEINQVMESIVEVKDNVDKQVRNMTDQVNKVQDDMQGLKLLVVQIANNLNEAMKKSNLSSS